MPRGGLRITKRKIDEMIKEGRGQGELSEYLPWLTIRDVPSKTLHTRVPGWKTGRMHHLFSRFEFYYFLIVQWALNVIDIREQFPLLPWQETEAIAQKLGFKPPADWKTKHAIVMTTDFMLTVNTPSGITFLARTLKPSKELKKTRVMEKLKIEEEYYGARGIDWGVVTEKEIPNAFVRNLVWVHSHYDSKRLAMPLETIELIAYELTRRVLEYDLSLREITEKCDMELSLREGSSMAVARHLVATRKWHVNMHRAIDVNKVIILLNANYSPPNIII